MKNEVISMIKKSRLVHNASWIIVCRVVQMGLSFLVSILTARYLGPSNFGVINYCHAFFAIFSSICTLGLENIVVKELVHDPNCQGETMGTIILLETGCSILCVISMTFLIGALNKFDSVYILVSFLYSLNLLFKGAETINYWYQYKLMSKYSSVVSIIAYLIVTAYKIFLLVTGKGIEWFALANAVDGFAVSIMLIILFRKHFQGKLSFSFLRAKQLLYRSYHFIISGIMVIIYLQTDKIMLKHMLDEATVGCYSVATTICTTWIFILTAIIDSCRPVLFEKYAKDKEDFYKKLQVLYTVIIYLCFIVAVLFLLFGKFAINLLYGEEYLQSAVFINIISWGTAFSYVGNARNIYSLSVGAEKYEKHMALIGMVMNIVLNYILISLIGAVGAAIATVITQIFINYIIMFFIKPLKKNGVIITKAFNIFSSIRNLKE